MERAELGKGTLWRADSPGRWMHRPEPRSPQGVADGGQAKSKTTARCSGGRDAEGGGTPTWLA